MRTILIGNFGTGWDGSICDEVNIAQALEKLGHEVCRIPRDNIAHGYAIPGGYDFMLVAQWDGYPIHFMDQLKQVKSGPIVYWCFDYQADGQPWHERLVDGADLYLSKRFADSKYKNWHWMCDFAPDFLHAAPDVEKDMDVLFTGSYLPWATERIETLRAVDKMFNLTIHSVTPYQWKEQGFKDVQGPVMDEALPALIARAKINLAIDHTLEVGYWSDRAAQAIACGGFVLQRYVPFMESFFHHNIMYFHNTDQCLEQIEWWLERDEDREVIEREAYENSPYYKCKERVADMLEIVSSIL